MEEYIIYLEKKTDVLKNQAKELENTDRKDEANLTKIQINVYDVCKTIFGVFKKVKAPEELKSEYLNKLSEMCSGWDTNLKKAREFGDVSTATAEELKIQTITDAITKFEEYWGE